MRIEQGVILCGGLGSRLGSLTAETPKPLLPVDGTPFLQILMREITRYGVRRFLLLAAYRSEQIESFARSVVEALGGDVEVQVVIEPDRAGTGGALYNARPMLDDAFFLFNGDTLLDTPLDRLAALLDDPEAIGAMALRRLEQAGRYGVTVLEGDAITAFGVPPLDDGPVYINGGVAAFRKTMVDGLRPTGSMEADLLPDLAVQGRLRGLPVNGFFLDIGVPEDFASAQTSVPAFVRRPALFLDRDGVINLDKGHVGSVDRFEWVEGAREAIKAANALDYYVFVVTNQAGIAKGYYTEADYQTVMDHIGQGLAEIGGRIDDVRFCPYHPDAVIADYRAVSDWRKPAPGMLLDLLKSWPVDRTRSLLIGDNQTDIQAANAAGVKGELFIGGRLDEFLVPLLTPADRKEAI